MFPLYKINNSKNQQLKATNFKKKLSKSISKGNLTLPSLPLPLLLLIILSITITITLSGCNSFNPQFGTLEGVVHRQVANSFATAPLPRVLIIVSGSNITTFSDQNGHFLLSEVPSGKKTINFIKDGYTTLRLNSVIIEPDIINIINSGEPIVLQPQEDTTIFNMAFDYLEQKEYNLALEALQELLDTFPNSSWADDAQYYIGEIHEIKGDYITAKEQYEKLLSRYPNSSWADDARIGMGNCYYQTGVYLKAIEQYQTVIDKYPSSNLVPLAYYRIGWCHRRLENYDESLIKFQQIITLFSESIYAPPAQYHIGEIHYDLGNYEKAVTAFQSTIDSNPFAVWPGQTRLIAPCAYFYKGYCLEKLKKWEEAITAYQIVIAQYPNSTWEDGKSIPSQAQERTNYIMSRY